MKVAVSALGPTLDDMVDSHFGRALWFIVADSEQDGFEAIDNAANKGALGGAGTAYPAVESRDRLTQLFKPLCWVLAV